MDATPLMKPALAAALLLGLAACATVPPPVNQLAAAEAAVVRADTAREDDPSSPELRAARSKLATAKSLSEARKYRDATRLAVEAELDATLAATRLDAAKARFTAESLEKSNEALRQQALRDSVNVAPIALPAPITLPDPAAEAMPAEPAATPEFRP